MTHSDLLSPVHEIETTGESVNSGVEVRAEVASGQRGSIGKAEAVKEVAAAEWTNAEVKDGIAMVAENAGAVAGVVSVAMSVPAVVFDWIAATADDAGIAAVGKRTHDTHSGRVVGC